VASRADTRAYLARAMRPVDVVMRDVLAQGALKVSSPQDHGLVEALAAGPAHHRSA